MGLLEQVVANCGLAPLLQNVNFLVWRRVDSPTLKTVLHQREEKWCLTLPFWFVGAGKTMLSRCIASETGALFFDLSPSNIAGKFTEGSAASRFLVESVFQVFLGGGQGDC